MRYYRDELAPQLAQLLFYGQRPEQFCLSLLALGNVDAEAKHVGLAVDFDDLSREQQRANGALPVASLALNLAHRTVALQVGPKLRAVFKIQPQGKLLRVVTNNTVAMQPIPSNKCIVRFDVLFIAQPRNRYEHRTGAKGRAEALLAFTQPGFRALELLVRLYECQSAFGDSFLQGCVKLADFVFCLLLPGNIPID